MEQVDVIIVGAGLSGVGAACHLQRECPHKSYLVLENREAIGGTWDLFRYPGIRSDSDMQTLGYDFKPWTGDRALADGPSIRAYVKEAADENGVTPNIRFGHKVVSADWSSADAVWTLKVQRNGEDAVQTLRCNLLLTCAGYYNYEQAHTPEFAGSENFKGRLVHPQFWPQDIDYSGQRVVIIGSGATAVTLVPAIAKDAEHVVMLQRSPTYVVSRSGRDWIANTLRKVLPQKWAYTLARWKNVLMQHWLYKKTRTSPDSVKGYVMKSVRKELGEDYAAQHFTPSYNPWDQRICLIPDKDMFDAINAGSASVVTDHIDHFTETGIALQSGEHLEADLVVSATGLQLSVLGGITFAVDGSPVDFSKTWTYRGIMHSEVPNLINTFGYISASWTLRADIVARFTCRLLQHMDATDTEQVTPRLRPGDEQMQARPWIDDFSAGYIQRAMHLYPQQGDREPWTNPQMYLTERPIFLKNPVDDDVLQFDKPAAATTADAA